MANVFKLLVWLCTHCVCILYDLYSLAHEYRLLGASCFRWILCFAPFQGSFAGNWLLSGYDFILINYIKVKRRLWNQPNKTWILSQHGRLRAVSFETASRDTQTLNLSRNVSKFYAWQVVSLMNEQQSQNLSLKVDPLSTIRNNNFDHAKWKTRNFSQVESFCIEHTIVPFKRRYTRYGFLFLVFRRL